MQRRCTWELLCYKRRAKVTLFTVLVQTEKTMAAQRKKRSATLSVWQVLVNRPTSRLLLNADNPKLETPNLKLQFNGTPRRIYVGTSRSSPW